jgi:uncharacterized membrane protein
MLVSSAISLVASLVLSIDAWVLASNPDANLSCNISATISCGAVADSWQAKLLGFPNAFIGLMAEPVVITIAVASLVGVVFPRRFLVIANLIYGVGFLFAYWLFYEAYFNIGALCPWCLAVTITTTTVFLTGVRINVLEGNFRFPPKVQEKAEYLMRLHADSWLAAILISVIAAAVLSKYL